LHQRRETKPRIPGLVNNTRMGFPKRKGTRDGNDRRRKGGRVSIRPETNGLLFRLRGKTIMDSETRTRNDRTPFALITNRCEETREKNV